jgi:methylthioribose-1-phosphate isomerase
MRVDGQVRRTVWPTAARDALQVIDQRQLPHALRIERLDSVDAVFVAIRDMWVRGAPLIGATAAYGLALQAGADARDVALQSSADRLAAARPTAVNLGWALQRMLRRLRPLSVGERAAAAWREADAIADEDVTTNQAIGRHGLELLRALTPRRPGPLNVLTHCNAGWLATVDWGTALAPVYQAQAEGVDVHVWVDETRPRNQGASLTAWELGQQRVPTTACPFMWRCRCRRWTCRCTMGCTRSRSRNAAHAKSRTSVDAPPMAHGSRYSWPPTAASRPTRPST